MLLSTDRCHPARHPAPAEQSQETRLTFSRYLAELAINKTLELEMNLREV